jgi:acetyl-CoA C-acetyltransferase
MQLAIAVRLKAIEKGGVVTAGNASPAERCGGGVPRGRRRQGGELGLEPLGWFTRLGGGRRASRRAWASARCRRWSAVPAHGPWLEDIDLFELNEAFAPQVLAVLKGWGWNDADKLNVNGSGISLGHPIGATGGRISRRC